MVVERLVDKVVLHRPSCERLIVPKDGLASGFDFDLASLVLGLRRWQLDPRRLGCREEEILALGCKGEGILMQRRVPVPMLMEVVWGLGRRNDFVELVWIARWRSKRIGKELELDEEVESELVERSGMRRMRKRDLSRRFE